jgi:hypothetical protein
VALTSEDFQQLKTTIEDLIRAERDLTAAYLRATPAAAASASASQGGQGGQGGGGAAAGVQVGASLAASSPRRFGSASGKSDASDGFGLSSLRQLLAGAGNSGIPGAGTLASLASGGGLPGIAAAGMGAIHQAVETAIAPNKSAFLSGARAFGAAPTSDSRQLALHRERYAEERGEMDSLDKIENEFNVGPKEYAKRVAQRAQRRRYLAQEEADELGPQDSALEITRRQLSGFAAAGGLRRGPEGEGGRQLADRLYEMNLRFTNGMQDFEKWARDRDRRLTSTAPGNAAGMAGQ